MARVGWEHWARGLLWPWSRTKEMRNRIRAEAMGTKRRRWNQEIFNEIVCRDSITVCVVNKKTRNLKFGTKARFPKMCAVE